MYAEEIFNVTNDFVFHTIDYDTVQLNKTIYTIQM